MGELKMKIVLVVCSLLGAMAAGFLAYERDADTAELHRNMDSLSSTVRSWR